MNKLTSEHDMSDTGMEPSLFSKNDGTVWCVTIYFSNVPPVHQYTENAAIFFTALSNAMKANIDGKRMLFGFSDGMSSKLEFSNEHLVGWEIRPGSPPENTSRMQARAFGEFVELMKEEFRKEEELRRRSWSKRI